MSVIGRWWPSLLAWLVGGDPVEPLSECVSLAVGEHVQVAELDAEGVCCCRRSGYRRAGVVGGDGADDDFACRVRQLQITVGVWDFEEGKDDAATGGMHEVDGASQVLIISGPSDPAPHRGAINAAKMAGAQRILYTSHQGAKPRSQFAATSSHAQTEQDLRESGVAFTALRNGFYATSAIQLMGQAATTGTIVVPEDGPVSWTAHADLADAAVIALSEPDRLHGITPPLTGPEALDFADIARIASELTGRDIRRVTVSDDEWTDSMLSYGLPEAHISLLLGVFVASRNGEFATVDPTLRQLLEREPTPFRDVLAGTLAS